MTGSVLTFHQRVFAIAASLLVALGSSPTDVPTQFSERASLGKATLLHALPAQTNTPRIELGGVVPLAPPAHASPESWFHATRTAEWKRVDTVFIDAPLLDGARSRRTRAHLIATPAQGPPAST